MKKSLAIVTGSAHRLGKAFAISLARMGYSIVLHYHNSETEVMETKTEIESLGFQAFPIQADLSDPDQIQSLFTSIDQLLIDSYQLSIVVNSAAIMPIGRPPEVELKDWDSALDLNLRAPFLISQAAAQRMAEGGLIVNITDVAAQKTWSRYTAYSVSKAGLEAMTKMLARALSPEIRVNAIAPGLVLHSDVVDEEKWNELVDRLPLKRPAQLDEIASTLEFLVKNEYITGQTIVVDGGYSLL